MALLRKVYVFRHLSNYHCKLLAKSFRTIILKAQDKVVTEVGPRARVQPSEWGTKLWRDDNGADSADGHDERRSIYVDM
eukprot:19779-Amphidinium_carterae.1